MRNDRWTSSGKAGCCVWSALVVVGLVAIAGCHETVPQNPRDAAFRGEIRPGFAGSECGTPHYQAMGSFPKSETMWLVAGEGICSYWEEFTIEVEEAEDPTQVTTCAFCNIPPCGGIAWPGSSVASDIGPQVRLYHWPFPIFDDRDQVATYGWHVGCTTNTRFPFPSYLPETNGGFTLVAGPGRDETSTFVRAGEGLEVILVPAGGELEMPPRFLMPAQSEEPDVLLFRWGVEVGQRWSESFSPNMRVTRVRVLKGKIETGRFFDSVGDGTDRRLVDSEPVLFRTLDFGQNLDCDAQAGTEDGNVDLTQCRDGADLRPRTATPAYEIISELASPLGIRAPQRVEWTIEFHNRGAFQFPDLDEDDDGQPDLSLAIVFTLKAVPSGTP